MGRPKGSKNKKNKKVKKAKRVKRVKKTKVKAKKPIFRPKRPKRPKKSKGSKKPKKSKKIYLAVKNEPKYKPPKSHTFLGYCSKCKGMVSSSDLISTYIFICPSCGKHARTKVLRRDKKRSNTFNSKKEYLEVSLAAHTDMPPMYEKDELENVKVNPDA